MTLDTLVPGRVSTLDTPVPPGAVTIIYKLVSSVSPKKLDNHTWRRLGAASNRGSRRPSRLLSRCRRVQARCSTLFSSAASARRRARRVLRSKTLKRRARCRSRRIVPSCTQGNQDMLGITHCWEQTHLLRAWERAVQVFVAICNTMVV